LDIQRIRGAREGKPQISEQDFDAMYGNVFAFNAELEKTGLAKLSGALVRYLKENE
jgi:hypothetical protein